MKKIISIIIIGILPILSFAAPRFTADFYKSDPLSYNGKVVTVKICSAKPSSFEAVKGYVSFHCYTAYQTERGGYIYALVPAEKAKSFSRNYGEVTAKTTVDGESKNIPTKDCKGKFTQIENEYVLVVQ